MPIVRQTSISGSYAHPSTGNDYDYEVNCQVAVDSHGRESMHIRGQVSRGNAATGFVVIGHVDPEHSFLGREERVAMDCVAVACARVASPVAFTVSGACVRRPAALAARRGSPAGPALMRSLVMAADAA